MIIQIASGIGTGPTKLAAFDTALNAAGVANYNLIRLSSIVPPKSKLIVNDGPIEKLSGTWGDRLYIVMADMRVDTPNMEAWAGVGWVQDEETGKGLFVEHEGTNEQTVKRDIQQSLEALMRTRGVNYGEIKMKVTGCICDHEPVCALAIAVFQSSSWKDNLAAKVPGLKS